MRNFRPGLLYGHVLTPLFCRDFRVISDMARNLFLARSSPIKPGINKRSMKIFSQILGTLLFTIFLHSATKSQPIKPAIFLSQIEMSPSGGQPYDQFYWLNSSNASLTKTGVSFPVTGIYRVDISVKDVIKSPNLAIKIDGTTVANMTITTSYTTSGSPITIYSVMTSSITAGIHTLVIQLTNFSYPNNYVKVGLIYFTRTTDSVPYVYPPITPLSFTPGVTMLTGNHFGSGKLRGFSLGGNATNQPKEDQTSMSAMKATGANIARCFVAIERPSGSDAYQFTAGELTKLDTTVARAARLGFYVVPALCHDPSLNKDYWGNTARKLSIINLWKTIAAKYKGNPAIGAYDLINEPRNNFNYAEVIRWQSDMIDTIRTIDPDHVIAVECINNEMFAMMLPLAYTNIVYSPHGYSTLEITHQGVDPYDPTENVINKYPTLSSSSNLAAVWGKAELSAQHNNVRIMSHRFNVPIYVGEFSCINWAPLNDSGQWTSTAWVNDNISLLETEKWSWTYHAWRGDYVGWEAEIPSSYYKKFTFSNGAPQGLPSYNTWITARTDTAATNVMLKKWFALNKQTGSINIYYHDLDNDGYGNTTDTVMRSSAPAGYVTQSGDCNDGNVSVHPGAVEICGNGIDDNCDGQIDEGCVKKNPSVVISDASAYESQGTETFTVTLSDTTSLPVTINYSTQNGTAIRKQDYTQQSNALLTIPAGSLTGKISIKILKDGTSESSEYFYVKMNSCTNASIGDTLGKGTIMDGTAPLNTTRVISPSTAKSPVTEGNLFIKAQPNPSAYYFNLFAQSNSNESLVVRVIDLMGNVMEIKTDVASNSVLKLGNNLKPGIYIIEVIQGKEKKQLKVIKTI